MQRADLPPSPVQVSLLFDQVAQAKDCVELRSLAKIYAAHEQFLDDHDMILTFQRRFDEITDDMVKRNWVLFCLQVLNRKDFPTLEKYKDSLTNFTDKCKTVKGLSPTLFQLKDLLEIKKNEYRLECYVEIVLKNPVHFIYGLAAHGWYFDTQSFVKEVVRQGTSSKETLPLVEKMIFWFYAAEPDLFRCDWMRKLVRKCITYMDEAIGVKIGSLLQKVHPCPSPRVVGSRPKTSSDIMPVVTFAKAFEESSHFVELAEDLSHFQMQLLSLCSLSELSRCNYSKIQHSAINEISGFDKAFGSFVKRRISAASSKKQKASVIGFFINLAWQCYKKRDHASTFTLVSALESPEASYPKEVWSKIDDELHTRYTHMVEKFSPLSRYANLRSLIYSYSEADSLYIPFIAPILGNLTSVDEVRPDMVDDDINFKKVEAIGALLEPLFRIKERLTFTRHYHSDLIALIDKEKKDDAS